MIDLTKASTVHIGRRGEHHFRNIEFDVSSLLGEDYPGAALQAIYKRPDGAAYPVVTNYADSVLTWSPSATDTENVGVGQLEIRVVFGDVVGKSVKVLTIVEEALVDGIVTPPEPPAQEWLNQVLSALAELDIDELNNLLNLTYNLLNTTHDLIEDSRDNMYMRTGILLNHLHPIETATAPDMISRRASITFSSISNGNNVVIGTVTYSFVTALGSPAANNVQVLIQDTLRNTVKILAKAIRGVEDEANIAYGAGTDPNPICTAYWTSQRFSIGSSTIDAGESLFILEREENATSAIVLTSTTSAAINPFTRISYLRYLLSGNVSGSGGANSVRGPLHTVLPIGSVVIGGQGGLLYPATYDCHLITLCRQSDTSEKELDFYISNDEETFTRLQRSTPIGSNTSAESLHVDIEMRQARVPAGYGLYVCMGSDGTSSSAYCDLKFTSIYIPLRLRQTQTIDCEVILMNLRKLILINNACFKAGRTITPKGIMVHSTGVNNPNLKRYVGPDDGLLGKNQYNNHWNQDKPGGRQVCVHAFIGKLADGKIATYQTMPWNHRGWHGGSGSKGSVNDTHIGFEICEDGLTDKAYFNTVYKEAADLCAYLCKEYKLDPMADGVIIGHYEGHKRGIASNHADPGHWFPKHGKSMYTFRAEVKRLLTVTEPSKPQPPTEPKKLYRVQVGAYSVKVNADAMLKRVKAAGFKDAFIKYSE